MEWTYLVIVAFILSIVWMIIDEARTIRRLNNNKHAVSAKVVGHRDYGTDRSEYRPVVEYSCEGKVQCQLLWVREAANLEESRQKYPLGSKVTVYIDPDKPDYCSESPETEASSRSFELGIMIVGLLFVLLLSLEKLS